jgi:hypothetical protein
MPEMTRDLDQPGEDELVQVLSFEEQADEKFVELANVLEREQWQVRLDGGLLVAWKTDDFGSWEVSAVSRQELLRRAWRHDEVRAEQARIASRGERKQP